MTMNGMQRCAHTLLCGSLLLAPLAPAVAQQPAPTRDGQHDFDFEIGTWKTHLRRLQHPLTGSTAWVEYEGTTVVRKVLDGRANLVELVADGPAGHFEGMSLRLYDPEAHQWSLNFASAATGTLSTPTIGEFRDGRGEFYDQEKLGARAILVRFLIIPADADTCRFEQAFSADGGKSWETNWVAIDTRVTDAGLEQAVREYDQAQTRNDTTTLGRLFADDYVLVNSDASVEDKQQALADFHRPGFHIEPYIVEQPVQKVWSDGAVTGGVVHLSWTQDGRQQQRAIRIAHTWQKRDGRWQLTYTQVTRVPE